MAARFERDEEFGPAGIGAGGFQRDDLGVRAAEAAVVAFADDPAVAHHDGADHRIGLDASEAPARQGQGPAHGRRVAVRRVHRRGFSAGVSGEGASSGRDASRIASASSATPTTRKTSAALKTNGQRGWPPAVSVNWKRSRTYP